MDVIFTNNMNILIEDFNVSDLKLLKPKLLEIIIREKQQVFTMMCSPTLIYELESLDCAKLGDGYILIELATCSIYCNISFDLVDHQFYVLPR